MVMTVDERMPIAERRDEWLRRLRQLAERAEEAARKRLAWRHERS